jgi:predicted transcriptional regulator
MAAVKELTELDMIILTYLHENRGYHSPYTIGKEIGEPGKVVAQILDRLAEEGLVRKSLAALVYGITDEGVAVLEK